MQYDTQIETTSRMGDLTSAQGPNTQSLRSIEIQGQTVIQEPDPNKLGKMSLILGKSGQLFVGNKRRKITITVEGSTRK